MQPSRVFRSACGPCSNQQPRLSPSGLGAGHHHLGCGRGYLHRRRARSRAAAASRQAVTASSWCTWCALMLFLEGPYLKLRYTESRHRMSRLSCVVVWPRFPPGLFFACYLVYGFSAEFWHPRPPAHTGDSKFAPPSWYSVRTLALCSWYALQIPLTYQLEKHWTRTCRRCRRQHPSGTGLQPALDSNRRMPDRGMTAPQADGDHDKAHT